MERHVRNARKGRRVSCSDIPLVSWVNYPGLPDSPYHALAQKYLPKGAGGDLHASASRVGARPARASSRALTLISHLANVGDAKTLIIHPASTTHQQLSDEQQIAAGVSPDLIRISVGLEDPADI